MEREASGPQVAAPPPEFEVQKKTHPALARLRTWMRPQLVVEKCELCSAALRPEHQHVFDPSRQQLACACDPCAILFSSAASGNYRSLPRGIRHLASFQCSDAEWESLAIPINLAFFRYSTAVDQVVAFYPSPAGPIESRPPLAAWSNLVEVNAVLGEMLPDVEALLANRIAGKNEWFLTPIDECYKLIGVIRGNWRGLGGGSQVWAEVEAFFNRLRKESRAE